MTDPINLSAVERRAADLLARRHSPGLGPGGWRSLADVRPFELQRIIVDDVLTLSGAGLLAPAESESTPPVRVSRDLPRTYPVGPARAGFDWVTVDLPGPPTRERWGIARQLANGLTRGETALVFPPGAVVTYSAAPPTRRPAAAGGFAAPEFLDPPFAPEPESGSGATLAPVSQPNPTTVGVTVHTANSETLFVPAMPVADAEALVAEFQGPTVLTNQVLAVTLNDCARSYLARRHITRIDLDFDPPAADD